jgi:large subunit ribosomal protein L16
MLQLKKQQNFKSHKKRFLKGIEHRSTKLQFGYYGLKAMGKGTLNFKQIEAGRKALNQKLKRTGKIWIRIFPNLPISSKPIETRMGKGKGNVSEWIIYIKPGMVLYELSNVPKIKALTALKNAALKFSFKTKIIYRII